MDSTKRTRLHVDLSEFVYTESNAKDNKEKMQVELENEINVLSMAKENDIGPEIKTVCKRYEVEGKQILVLVAEKDHCHWYGSTLATQFIMEQYLFIFKFFSFCQVKDVNDINDRLTTENANADPHATAKCTVADSPASTDTMDATRGDSKSVNDDGSNDDEDVDDDHNNIDYQDELDTAKNYEKGMDKAVHEYLSGKINEQYSCSKCGAKFSHEEHLKTHEKKRLKCNGTNFKQKYRHSDMLDEDVTFVDTKTREEVRTTFRQVLDNQKGNEHAICPICGKIFLLISWLSKHLKQHSEKAIFECNICNDRFKHSGSLVHHTKLHFEAPYECYKCRKRFKTKELATNHMENRCQKSYKEYMLEHYEEDEKLRCGQCNYKAAHPIMLTAHKTSHNGPLLCVCTECGRQLSCMASLFRHILSVHLKGPIYSCPICKDKTYKDKASLQRHMLIHGERKFICQECGKGFKEKGNLRTHIKTHSNIKPFMCDYCGEKYKRKVFLDNHRRIHTGDRPFLCDFEGCGKSFRSTGSLAQHKRTHNTCRYICDICGTKFKHPNTLNYHRKSHTDEHRWACAYCAEKFKTIWRYKQHLVNSHPEKKTDIERTTKIKLHQCKLCQKLYHDPEDLTRHMNNHNGIKPYQCSVCEKLFSDRSNLRAHMFIHSGGKKYSCHVCHKKFIQEKNLNYHIYKVHPKDPPASLQPYTIHQQQMLTQDNQESVYVTVGPLQILKETCFSTNL